jgi:Fur family peroxide stress response transcriptional regulator
MNNNYIIRIKEAGLKVTPQRTAVLEALDNCGPHPTADRIIGYVRMKHPGIATGTVYNVLGILVEKKIIKKVKTDRDVMHYDGIVENHHHLYCVDSDRIEDYNDSELDHLLKSYFEKKSIPGFNIQEIKVQINGDFNKKIIEAR